MYYWGYPITLLYRLRFALWLWPCQDATIPWAHVGRSLVGHPCALVGWALVGPSGLGPCGLGPCGPAWVLLGRAFVGAHGPLHDGLAPAAPTIWLPQRSDTARGMTDDIIVSGSGSGSASCTMTPVQGAIKGGCQGDGTGGSCSGYLSH